MRLQGSLVAVDLMEEEMVCVGPILQDVEPHTSTTFVADGADRVVFDHGKETIALVGLDLHGHDEGEHASQGMRAVRCQAMIRAQALVKEFTVPGGVRAVDGLTFEVAPGEIYGLLGPNGAGKTTALRLLSALLRPTSGSAIVAGYSVAEQPDEVRARIGILTEVPGLYTRLTPMEYLDFFAQLHGFRQAAQRGARVEEMLRLVGLWERRSSVMRAFSKGMQQRVAIARTLLQDPTVLLFDEPTAALDPEAARSIRDYLRELATSRSRTVLLCTHNLFEADQLCSRLSIIQHGRQVTEGTPAALKRGFATTCVLRVRDRSAALMASLCELPAIDFIRLDGPGSIMYRTRDPKETNPVVIRAAVAAGADVMGLAEAAASLEEVYLKLVNQEVVPRAPGATDRCA
jgi:ABC-2 type transport system ATP-binding protein